MDECKPLLRGVCVRDSGYDRYIGRAVQLDPMEPKLKPPGTMRLKLNCDILLSTSSFKINLRRYTAATPATATSAAIGSSRSTA